MAGRANLHLMQMHMKKCWWSHCCYSSSSTSLSIPRSSYTSLLFNNAHQFPDKVALVNGVTGERLRYSELLQGIGNISSGLWKLGIRQGDIVNIVGPNCPEHVMAQHGIMETGATVTYSNPASTEYEIENQLKSCKPRVILTTAALVDKVAVAAKRAQCCEKIFLFDAPESGQRSSTFKSFQRVLLEDKGDESQLFNAANVPNPENHIAQLPYSSGTTGLPKGVMLSHYNLCANLMQIQAAKSIKHGRDVILAVLPLFHIYAAIIQATTFHTGNKMITLPKFEPNSYLKAIDEHQVSLLHVVPPLVLFLLQTSQKVNLSSVDRVMCAAAPLLRDVENKFLEKFRPQNPELDIFQGYGLSETAPLTHLGPPLSKRGPNKQGSVGMLIPDMECRVVDTRTGNSLGPRQPGELWVRGPNVMLGYYNNPQATRECIVEDGWFRTGDVLYYDEDGYFYIVDRLKELIKYKGFQVAPAELENVLLTHPGIQDTAVVGIHDSRAGEVPLAFVVRKDKDLKEEQVQKFVADRLSDHKHLRGGVRFVDEIPKSASGKILRKDLRKLYLS